MSTVFLVFPHQLFKITKNFPKDVTFAFIEDELYFRQFPFHKQKLVLHRASMQALRECLLVKGFRVEYYASVDFPTWEHIVKALSALKPTEIRHFDVADDWLSQRIRDMAVTLGVKHTEVPTPAFFLQKKDIAAYKGALPDRDELYIKQRQRLGILTEADHSPIGGAWRFESQNQRKTSKNLFIPEIRIGEPSRYAEEALAYVEATFPNNYGFAELFAYPVTHGDAADWLDDFIHNRLEQFGPFQDALSSRHPVLFHSVLSPLLNVGLLTPKQVVDAVQRAAQEQDVPLNSLEAFFHGIVGWREHIRLTYEIAGRKQRAANFWRSDRPVPEAFRTAHTSLPPVDTVLERVMAVGYAHHNERLAILGSFLTLIEVEPDEAYAWFMTAFVDAYDWVTVPNLYGLGLFADGGLLAAKPALSPSQYVRKMSDYPAGPWSEIWDALYWRFVNRHRAVFAANPKLRAIPKQLDRLGIVQVRAYERKAEKFLAGLW